MILHDYLGIYDADRYTFWRPHPYNASHYIRLSIERDYKVRDSELMLDFNDLSSFEDNNSRYNFSFIAYNNATETLQTNLLVRDQYGSTLYDLTSSANLQKETNFTLPFGLNVFYANGTLIQKFNITLTLGTAVIYLEVNATITPHLPPGAWVTGSWGILESIEGFFDDIGGGTLIKCGAGSMPLVGTALNVIETVRDIRNIANGQLGSGGYVENIGVREAAESSDELATIARAATALLVGTGFREAAKWIPIAGNLLGCYDTWNAATTEQERIAWQGGAGAKFSNSDWYCTNRPSIDIPLDIPDYIDPDDIVSMSLLTSFSPWTDVRPHDINIYMNNNLIWGGVNTIPSGHEGMSVDPSYLIYGEGSTARNTIQIRTSHMNGGHYIVSSSFTLVMRLRYIPGFMVVAENQTEADNYVKTQLDDLETKPDFKIISTDISFDKNTIYEKVPVTISAKVANYGTGSTSVKVFFYDGSTKIGEDLIEYFPTGSVQTATLEWTPPHASSHSIKVVVDAGNDITEILDTNNQAISIMQINDLPTPVITTTNRTVAFISEEYNVDYNATDYTGTLVWSLATNASFLSITSTTGVLSGTPGGSDKGSYWVNVTVNDDFKSSFANFTLLVLEDDTTAPVVVNVTRFTQVRRADTNTTVYANVTDNAGIFMVYLYYSNDNATWSSVLMSKVSGNNSRAMYCGAIPASGSNATIYYYAKAQDVRPNYGESKTYNYSSVKPPVTTLTVALPGYRIDYVWYVSGNTTIILTASLNGGPAVNYTKYKVDDGSWKSYTAPFNLSAYENGAHTLYFYSVNIMGIVEATESASFLKNTWGPGDVTLGYPASNNQTSERQVTFSWQTVSDVSYYHLQVSNNSNFDNFTISVNVHGTSYTTPFHLKNGTSFWWRVRAGDRLYNTGNWSVTNKLTVDSTTITVGTNEDYQSIQAAINAAPVGHTVRVIPGIYEENITVGKNVTLESHNGQVYVVGDLLIGSAGKVIMDNVSVLFDDIIISEGGIFQVTASPNTIEATGNVYVDGLFTLDNTTLKMNCDYDGQYRIQVNATGTMEVINGSFITRGASNTYYDFYVVQYATFTVTDSIIERAGYSTGGSKGVRILTLNTTMENSTIRDGYHGVIFSGVTALTIANLSFASNITKHLVLESSSNITIRDSGLNLSKVNCDATSYLGVWNTLRVMVLLADNSTPISGAHVEVVNNGEVVYASSHFNGTDAVTNSTGHVKYLPMFYAYFDGVSDPTYVGTRVQVWDDTNGYDFTDTPRDVNMSSNHTEYFPVVPEFSSIFVPVVFFLVLFLVVKRRRRLRKLSSSLQTGDRTSE